MIGISKPRGIQDMGAGRPQLSKRRFTRKNGRFRKLKRPDAAVNARPRTVVIKGPGTGSKALMRASLDLRSTVGREYFRRLGELRAHVGGDPSVPEARLLDQAARLGLLVDIAWSALIQARTVLKSSSKNGLHPAFEAFRKAATDERAVLQMLGIKRRAKDVPTVQEYIRQKQKEKELSDD